MVLHGPLPGASQLRRRRPCPDHLPPNHGALSRLAGRNILTGQPTGGIFAAFGDACCKIAGEKTVKSRKHDATVNVIRRTPIARARIAS